MLSGVKVSSWHSRKQAGIYPESEKMAESEGIKGIVNQASIKAATVFIRAFQDAGPQPTTTVRYRKPQRESCGGPILENPSFNLEAQDKYVKLMEL